MNEIVRAWFQECVEEMVKYLIELNVELVETEPLEEVVTLQDQYYEIDVKKMVVDW